MSFNIIPPKLAVRAMRDSGYKNAAYAIAELVDNSIQAGALLVEVLVREEEELVRQRVRARAKEIAVLDNGSGMSAEVLRRALQFGNGERLADRSGMGRFGMGLPNASLSQAKRVEVWSWQEGPDRAMYTYLDVDEIASGDLSDVPEPRARPAPPNWLRRSSATQTPRSGTLVLWSGLDRCEWRTALAIFKNSEATIGRVYRRFIRNGRVQVRMGAFVEEQRDMRIDDYAQPNDPLYLMKDTSCPEPWDKEPMFEAYGIPNVLEARTFVGGRWHDAFVQVRFSVAKPEARSGDFTSAGATKHGQHARDNIGVSVVRADRELELQREWCIGYDPRERWWGCEVEFDPALDEVFGVTNNKQHARVLAEFALTTVEEFARREGYDSLSELEEEWERDNDPRLVLLRVKKLIESNLAAIRKSIRAHGERQRKKGRYDIESAEARGTRAIEERKHEGRCGASDAGEQLDDATRQEEIAAELAEKGVDRDEAERVAAAVVSDRRKFEFVRADIDTAEFFTVRSRGGAILISLNTNHPAYSSLVTVLDGVTDTENVIELRGRLQTAYEGLKLLFEAWARYEDELPVAQRERAQETRYEWGKVAKQFFQTS